MSSGIIYDSIIYINATLELKRIVIIKFPLWQYYTQKAQVRGKLVIRKRSSYDAHGFSKKVEEGKIIDNDSQGGWRTYLPRK